MPPSADTASILTMFNTGPARAGTSSSRSSNSVETNSVAGKALLEFL